MTKQLNFHKAKTNHPKKISHHTGTTNIGRFDTAFVSGNANVKPTSKFPEAERRRHWAADEQRGLRSG